MKYCDKCGKQVMEPKPVKADFPRYHISVDESFDTSWKGVDLCHECELRLYGWIRTPPEPEKTEPEKAEPVVGEWIFKDWIGANSLYQCSICGSEDEHNANVEVPFCWHCGSPMKTKPKGGDDV